METFQWVAVKNERQERDKGGGSETANHPLYRGGFAVLLFDHFMIPLYFVHGTVIGNRKYRKIFVSFAVVPIRGIE